MDYEILPPTDDWIFKLLFGDERNKSMLIDLLRSFLELPQEEYELVFLNTNLKQEAEDDKLGILDVKVQTTSGKVIDIEIQVNPVKSIGKRISFYKSKLIVEQIAKGDYYSVIEKVICVCITDYVLFHDKTEYLNSVRFYNPRNGLCFEDIPEEVYTLELPKVPALSDGSAVWQWTQFLRAKRKEEFEVIAVQNPEIRKAVDTLYELSADERTRAEYELHMRAVRDRAWLRQDGYEEGYQKGEQKGLKIGLQTGLQTVVRNLKAMGESADKIAGITGLSLDEIKKLP
jgi:predicted transposase/invertase (TIGR01784 family)